MPVMDGLKADPRQCPGGRRLRVLLACCDCGCRNDCPVFRRMVRRAARHSALDILHRAEAGRDAVAEAEAKRGIDYNAVEGGGA